MDLNSKEQIIADQAREWVRAHREEIIAHFVAGIGPVDSPVSVFMVGSPGAGKTEFSKRLVGRFGKDVVRIDADEIRDMLPQYHGGNAYLFQRAISFGMDKLYDHVLDKGMNVVVDGTLRNYEKAKSNIERSSGRDRKVEVFYVYQEPDRAWDFTRKREVVEGRNIPKEAFIDSFFLSRENVLKLKRMFGDRIPVHVVLKNMTNDDEEIFYDVADIDSYVKTGYTRDELERNLVEDPKTI